MALEVDRASAVDRRVYQTAGQRKPLGTEIPRGQILVDFKDMI
jgi:hypothetical protein